MQFALDIRAIIDQGGGPQNLAARSKDWVEDGRLRKPIAEKTIYSWIDNGVPEKHWHFVAPECRVALSDLHSANEALRARAVNRVGRSSSAPRAAV